MLLSDPGLYLLTFISKLIPKVSVCLRVIHDSVRGEMDLDDEFIYIPTVVPVLVKTEENSGRNMRRVYIPASHCALKACSLDQRRDFL